MDETEDDARIPPNPYGVNHQKGVSSSARQKIPFQGSSYSRPIGSQYGDEHDEDDDEDEELGEEEDDENNNNENGMSNGYPVVLRKDVTDMDDEDDEDDDEDEDDDDDDDDEDHGKRKDYNGRNEGADLERRRRKRKLKSLISSYEFAPRVPMRVPSTTKPSSSIARQSLAGRNSLTDWTERETVVLLDAWGDRFLQRGKKSLRSEEWQEVAEKVSEVSKVDRTDTQCRNRLDTLKKKYKKEKLSSNSNWVYFKKMDLLLSMSSPPQQPGLSCGMDSGEYVFMNPRVYLHRANGLDEMRDSPGNSESAEDNDGSDGLPPKKRKYGKDNDDDNEGSSFSLIAKSIHRFSEIYEKIEASKRQQMMEIEKMRMDFQRDLEMQKRQIMERAHAEIAKIRRGCDENNDVSAENGSG